MAFTHLCRPSIRERSLAAGNAEGADLRSVQLPNQETITANLCHPRNVLLVLICATHATFC
jgi:hypothetical protein